MIEHIELITSLQHTVMVVVKFVAWHLWEEICWIPQHYFCLRPRSHRVVTYHVSNVGNTKFICLRTLICAIPVCTVTIIVFSVDLINTRVLKHSRCVDLYRITLQADHIVTKFNYPRTFWMVSVFCLTNSTKIQIPLSVVIYKYRRVKQPRNFSAATVWCLTADQLFSNRITPWACGAVSLKYADTASIICKVDKELIFSIDLFICYRRCPAVCRPFCRTVLTSHLDDSLICPVHHIFG